MAVLYTSAAAFPRRTLLDLRRGSSRSAPPRCTPGRCASPHPHCVFSAAEILPFSSPPAWLPAPLPFMTWKLMPSAAGSCHRAAPRWGRAAPNQAVQYRMLPGALPPLFGSICAPVRFHLRCTGSLQDQGHHPGQGSETAKVRPNRDAGGPTMVNTTC